MGLRLFFFFVLCANVRSVNLCVVVVGGGVLGFVFLFSSSSTTEGRKDGRMDERKNLARFCFRVVFSKLVGTKLTTTTKTTTMGFGGRECSN